MKFITAIMWITTAAVAAYLKEPSIFVAPAIASVVLFVCDVAIQINRK